jgi:hypothetical protein
LRCDTTSTTAADRGGTEVGGDRTLSTDRTQATPAADPADGAWLLRPSRRTVVGAVARRLGPYLVEATVIPTLAFYIVLAATRELRWALLGTLAWSFAAVARRRLAGRPIPGLLVLATLGISVRTLVYLCSGNSFVYFVQPILRTALTAALFAGSVLVGRPLIERFASDFCPISVDVQQRPGIMRLFRRLTYLWAGANALVAAAALALLLTVPASVFVATAAVSAWTVTCACVVLTVADSVATARREGLITALSPNGTLYASTVHPGAR